MARPIPIGKLVRDRMPDVIRADGYAVDCVAVDTKYMQRTLEAKLVEEAGEYIREPSVGELVDLLEVVFCLAAHHRCAPMQLLALADAKRMARGSFADGVLLLSVWPASGDPQ